MNEAVKVYVIDNGAGCYYMQYKDPFTGKRHTRSTKQKKKSEAAKKAGQWEKELNEGQFKARSRVTWAELRQQFEASSAFDELAESSQRKFYTAFTLFEELLTPDRLILLTTARLNLLVTKLRDRGLAPFTIKGYLSLIRRALHWGRENGLLAEVPRFVMPRRAKGSKFMKGRPITVGEYDGMLAVIPKVVRASHVPKWQRLLEGLWLSGLRLGEAVNLWWDRLDRNHVVLSGQYPMLHFQSEHQKNRTEQLTPITPDFAAFLLKTPKDERTGRVFEMGCRGIPTISNIISKIGEKARVVVRGATEDDAEDDTEDGAKKANVKYASAHDFRRAFGTRWALKVMPQVLMELMRHTDLKTTQRFYVGRDAQSTAQAVWASVNSSDNNQHTVREILEQSEAG
jgi:integrase